MVGFKKSTPCILNYSGSKKKSLKSSDDYEVSTSFSNKKDNKELVQRIKEIFSDGKLIIHPNPFREKTTISFPNPAKKQYTLWVYGLSGKPVKQITNITRNRVNLESEGLKAGLYIVEVIGEEVIYKGKLIVK